MYTLSSKMKNLGAANKDYSDKNMSWLYDMARTCCQRLSTFKVMSLVNHLFAFFCYVIYLNPQYTLFLNSKNKNSFFFSLYLFGFFVMQQKFHIRIRFLFSLNTRLMTSKNSLNNFFFNMLWQYHKESLLFRKGLYFILKRMNKELDMQSVFSKTISDWSDQFCYVSW